MKVKQVIVMRSDLKNEKGEKVRTGKLTSQAAHASLSFLVKSLHRNTDAYGAPTTQVWGVIPKIFDEWVRTGTTKITLRVDSETELLAVFGDAKDRGLEVHLITDAGATEFGGIPTRTCLAIGPDDETKIDAVTGNLKLL